MPVFNFDINLAGQVNYVETYMKMSVNSSKYVSIKFCSRDAVF